jgi:hypothetical protein
MAQFRIVLEDPPLPVIHFESGESSGATGVAAVLEGAGGWPRVFTLVNDGGLWKLKLLRGVPAGEGFELDEDGYIKVYRE